MKKFLAMALALLMVCVMLPVTAMAASGVKMGGTEYPTLKAAVDAAPTDGTETTIEFLGSHTGEGVQVKAGQNLVIKFNGCTYTLTPSGAGSNGTKTAGFQLLKGSTVKFIGGTVNISDINLTYTKDETYTGPEERSCNIMRLIQSYADVTLTDMTFDATNFYGGPQDYALSFNKGQVNINGNTSITGNEGKIAFDSCDGSWAGSGVYNDNPLTAITIDTTGTISGYIEMSGGNLTIEDINLNGGITLYGNNTNYGANVIVNGGTFTDAESVKPYLAEGLTINSNGTVVNTPIVIIVPDDSTDTTTTTEKPANPATGANDFVGVTAALAVVSLLGMAVASRKK